MYILALLLSLAFIFIPLIGKKNILFIYQKFLFFPASPEEFCIQKNMDYLEK